ncbi:MAG: D-aminoacyl-tRNA deacylase [Candidatus ainarchaeum sp.]|nr:D-aminoacyl-tRNA deacylase [Candidatus ainarchaeum sp.]
MDIMFTKVNEASYNIAKNIKKIDTSIKLNEFFKDVLEVPTDFETDEIIVLSTHKSKNPKPMLTAHIPGNWGKAEYGGTDRTLNIADGNTLKKVIKRMDFWNKKLNLNWPVFIESDHHGPNCKVPIIFVEIGSSENEWGNEKAGEVVARAVLDILKDKSRYEEIFCIGGGHYSQKFTEIAVNGKYAVGHILPKYMIKEFDREMFIQAINKNRNGKVNKILIDRECNKWQKDKINLINQEFGIEIEEC